jgi:hypothetical protein
MYTITIPGKPHMYISAPLPVGWEIIGEITSDGEGIPGALIRNVKTGIYAQANAGAIRVLPDLDLTGETDLTASQAAALAEITVHGLAYWVKRGYLTPISGTSPARYKKADVLTAKGRDIKKGRPRKCAARGSGPNGVQGDNNE